MQYCCVSNTVNIGHAGEFGNLKKEIARERFCMADGVYWQLQLPHDRMTPLSVTPAT